MTATDCADGDIRLQDGNNTMEGRVEVCYDGVWGTVCSDFWTAPEATVVCRQLGLSTEGFCVDLGEGLIQARPVL